jgi:hypothetical protein
MSVASSRQRKKSLLYCSFKPYCVVFLWSGSVCVVVVVVVVAVAVVEVVVVVVDYNYTNCSTPQKHNTF